MKLHNPIVRIPRTCIIAVSGGSDSMILLKYAQQFATKIHLVHVNHATGEYANKAEKLVENYFHQVRPPEGLFGFTRYILKPEEAPETGKELYWRNKRLRAYEREAQAYRNRIPVLTAHHLDDAVENWIFTSLRGQGNLIPSESKMGEMTILRPFITYRKQELLDWAKSIGFDTWLDDPSNSSTEYTRNYIRHELMPHALRVNPGLHTMIRNKYVKGEWVSHMSEDHSE